MRDLNIAIPKEIQTEEWNIFLEFRTGEGVVTIRSTPPFHFIYVVLEGSLTRDGLASCMTSAHNIAACMGIRAWLMDLSKLNVLKLSGIRLRKKSWWSYLIDSRVKKIGIILPVGFFSKLLCRPLFHFQKQSCSDIAFFDDISRGLDWLSISRIGQLKRLIL